MWKKTTQKLKTLKHIEFKNLNKKTWTMHENDDLNENKKR